MSVQMAKVSRLTGEILERGYEHDDTRASEATVEAFMANHRNDDSDTAYITVDPERTYPASYVFAIIKRQAS